MIRIQNTAKCQDPNPLGFVFLFKFRLKNRRHLFNHHFIDITIILISIFDNNLRLQLTRPIYQRERII